MIIFHKKTNIGKIVNQTIFSFKFLYYKLTKKQPILITAWVSTSWGGYKHRNFGDDLNFILLKELTGRPIFVVDAMWPIFKKWTHYCFIGSIVEKTSNSHSVICGAGAMYGNRKITPPKEILSVRGPLTRKSMVSQGINCPEYYGDPALLLPLIYDKAVEKKYTYGIIPHFFDSSLPQINDFKKQVSDVLVINIQKYQNWHEVIDNIRSCKYILSSSLHGLIIADTYNIPNVWIELSHNVEGNGFKFQDYFISVGKNGIVPQDCTISICINNINKHLQKYQPIVFDRNEYRKKMPF